MKVQDTDLKVNMIAKKKIKEVKIRIIQDISEYSKIKIANSILWLNIIIFTVREAMKAIMKSESLVNQ